MKATLLPDLLTKLTPDEAIDALRLGFERVLGYWPENKVLALSVAQSALETGRWRSMHHYNWGNEKASASYEGFYCQFRCNEIIKGKVEWFNPPHAQCNFRAFQTAADGAADHMIFLSTRPRYAAAWAAKLTGDPALFVTQLKRAGYFTANEAQYKAAVVSLFNEFMRKLDGTPIAPGVPTPPLPESALDDEHSTFTADDLEPNLIDLMVPWDVVRSDRDRDIAEDSE